IRDFHVTGVQTCALPIFVDVKYRDLTVLPSATTSSPGLAFMLTTIAAFGDEWPQYWERVMANGAKLTSGWSDAYYVDFSQGGEKIGRASCRERVEIWGGG